MPNYDNETRAYVENYFFEVLSSPRFSQQLEEVYHSLSRSSKGATTRQLKHFCKIVAAHILDNIEDLQQLEDLDDDALIRAALRIAQKKAREQDDDEDDGENE